VAGFANWADVSISGDGSTLTALKEADSSETGGLYTSRGVSKQLYPFQASSLLGDWTAMAASFGFQFVVAVQRGDDSGGPGDIYLSANSAGNWYRRDSAGKAYWSSVTCTTENRQPVRFVAAQYMDSLQQPGAFWRSDDNGFTWFALPRTVMGFWSGIASASDLSVLVAVQNMSASGSPGSIYTSYNGGQAWRVRTSAPPAYWASVAASSKYHYLFDHRPHNGQHLLSCGISIILSVYLLYYPGDGQHLVATQYRDRNGLPGSVWRSVDFGVRWSLLSGAPYGYWTAISSSDDGSVLFAVQDKDESGQLGSLHLSVNEGATWIKDALLPPARWAGVSVSSDGGTFMATQGPNSTTGIYVGSFRADPPIGIMVAAAVSA